MIIRIADALAQSAFFRGLSREACERLAQVGHVRPCRKRESLFREGEHGEAMFYLIEGRVSLSKATPDGSVVVIKTVQPGESFAEVVLFESDRYPVTATALTPSKALALDRRDVLRLLESAGFRNAFITMLMRKQRYLTERLRLVTSCDVGERFRLFLEEQYGQQPALQVAISKKDIAAAIGATPETLSRLLQRLKRRGMLTWRGKTLTLNSRFWEQT
jgi:CRP/FNR family transcriptional regulator, dissimilatory nitrate respiration regulator